MFFTRKSTENVKKYVIAQSLSKTDNLLMRQPTFEYKKSNRNVRIK